MHLHRQVIWRDIWKRMMLESNKGNMTAFLGANILRKHLKEENWNYAHGLVKLNFICLNKCIFKYGSISCHHCQLEVSPWHFQILTQLHLSSLREFSLMLFTSIWLNLRCSRKLSPMEGRFWKWVLRVKKGVINLFLCISMAYNVISCRKIAKNTQTLKIADFTM